MSAPGARQRRRLWTRGSRTVAFALLLGFALATSVGCSGSEEAAGPPEAAPADPTGEEPGGGPDGNGGNGDGLPEPPPPTPPAGPIGPPEPLLVADLMRDDCGAVRQRIGPLLGNSENQAALAKGRLWLGMAEVCEGNPGAAVDDLAFAREQQHLLNGFNRELLALLGARGLPNNNGELKELLRLHSRVPDDAGGGGETDTGRGEETDTGGGEETGTGEELPPVEEPPPDTAQE